MSVENKNSFTISVPLHLQIENEDIKKVIDDLKKERPIEEQQKLVKTVTTNYY